MAINRNKPFAFVKGLFFYQNPLTIIKNGCIDIATTILTQMNTHATYGGVVPEIASRMHSENITIVLEEKNFKLIIVYKLINVIWKRI